MAGRQPTSGRAAVRGTVAVAALVAVASAGYVVRPGDTLTAIAARAGTTVTALADANDLADPDRIVAGQRLTVPSQQATRASRAESGRLVTQVAREWGWSPRFVKALAWQESGWRMDTRSSTGAVGIMQVMPGTGEFVSHALVGRTLDLHDPHDNVTAGVAFLDHLYDLTGGDVELTLGGYYQGLRSISENGMYPDTERYIANVLALRDRM